MRPHSEGVGPPIMRSAISLPTKHLIAKLPYKAESPRTDDVATTSQGIELKDGS